MQSLRSVFLVFCFIFLFIDQVIGQTKPLNPVTKSDTVRVLTGDTTTIKPAYASPVETTIKYKAKDSIYFDVKQRQVKLYGQTKIIYGGIELDAERTEIDWESSMITANGVQDSTGKKIGNPIFNDEGQKYMTQDMKYNFKTKKAYISGMITQQGEAFMHGSRIKKNEDNEMFIDSAKYTTCNLEYPHFHIASSKIKLLPGDKLVAGPFHLRVNDIPTPLGFGFGMFPVPRKRVSGVIFPTYGEERRRGFFLRDGGYYLALSDYANLAVLGEVYSKGSNGLSVRSDYRKRYAYSGNLNFRYNQQRLSENIEDTLVQRDYWLQWSHSPVPKGIARFSASVNAGTSSYNVNNPSDINRTINPTFNSSISYSTSIPGTPFNFASSLRHTQNVRTNQTSVNFPEVAVNMNRIYPLKFKGSSGRAWYEKINLAYNSNFSNQISNRPLKRIDGLDSTYYEPFNSETLPRLIRNGNNGVRHTVPISTSFNVAKYFTVSPSFNYNELWYFRELRHGFDSEQGIKTTDTLRNFSRAGYYNTGAGVNTRIYGTYYFKSERVKAIRHVMIPSVSYSYNPNYADPKYGFVQNVQIDTLGNTRNFTKFDGFIFGTVPQGQSSSVAFALSNNVEMKYRSPKDTSRTDKKVPIFENLSFGTSYNMLADSFKLSDFRIAARTRILNNRFDINFATNLDPYVWVTDSIFQNRNGAESIMQRRVNDYAWRNGQGIGRMKFLNLTVSTNLNPQARKSNQANTAGRGDMPPAGAIDPATGLPFEATGMMNGMDPQMAHLYTNPDEYVDFNIPWSLRLNYTFNWTRVEASRRATLTEPTIAQSIGASGDIKITDKWKIGYSTNYDLVRKEFTMSDLRIHRDLHCWEMNLNWTPFGRFTSYSLDVRVKASVLQDLKYNRRRTFWDNSRGF